VISTKSRAACLLLAALLTGAAGCGKIPFLGKKDKGEGVHTEEVLKRALQDKNPMVRKDAVHVLGEMIDTPENQMRSARVLAIALKDRDEEIRLEAVKTLGAIAPAYSNRYLKDALNDRSIKVRMLVVQIIAQMNEKRIADAKQMEMEKAKAKEAEKEKEAAQPASDNPLLPVPQPGSGQ
jgi:HEAT repeat protein